MFIGRWRVRNRNGDSVEVPFHKKRNFGALFLLPWHRDIHGHIKSEAHIFILVGIRIEFWQRRCAGGGGKNEVSFRNIRNLEFPTPRESRSGKSPRVCIKKLQDGGWRRR